MTEADKPHRNSILVESATILDHQAWAGEQYILRVAAPRIAAVARAGSFAHIRCGDALPMRRPLSIMRRSASDGWVDFLYKAVGSGTGELARREVGESLSIMGPIGVPFSVDAQRRRPLLIGGGVGIPPMVFIADELRGGPLQPFAIMGSEVPFPFTVEPSRILVPGVPADVIGAMPLLEQWGIASRLASGQGYAGCFDGYVTDLARHWLAALSSAELAEVAVYACGPTPMLKAVAALAAEFALPCQVSLEEYMACAVGGCAGCVVEVRTADGPAMQRVCVDGPVFDAAQVF